MLSKPGKWRYYRAVKGQWGILISHFPHTDAKGIWLIQIGSHIFTNEDFEEEDFNA